MNEHPNDSATLDRRPGIAGTLIFGIVSIVVGILAIVWPFAATLSATIIFASMLFVSGIFASVAALTDAHGWHRAYLYFYALLTIIVAALIVTNPLAGALTLTLWVAVWLAARGVGELVLAGRSTHRRGRLIALGIFNLLLAAFVVVTIGISALTLPGYILGLSLLFGGIVDIDRAMAMRRARHAPA